MTPLAKKAIPEVIWREGGYKYTNNKNDRGGATYAGMTQKTATGLGYKGDISKATDDEIIELYHRGFWLHCKCDEIAQVSEQLAVWVFDFAVNSSPAAAIAPLQGLLNSLNDRERLYADFEPAANVGPKTLAALRAYAKARDIKVLAYSYNGLRIAFLYNIARADKSQEANIYGWLHRVINLTKNVGV